MQKTVLCYHTDAFSAKVICYLKGNFSAKREQKYFNTLQKKEYMNELIKHETLKYECIYDRI